MTIFHLSTKLLIPQKNIVKVLSLLLENEKIENRNLLRLCLVCQDYQKQPFDKKIYGDVVSYISKLRQKQPRPKRKWDQFLATPEKILRVREIINKMNVAIEERYPGFNQYEDAYSIGCQSSLYVCSLIEKSKSELKGDYKGKIYTVAAK